ncbi:MULTISPECIES: HPr family phosphocarrier protein [Salimicrobium]|uniref:Phosphocarrier protein Chr n=4 Tax=Salimicrobium TaxID=351195 RepID=K2GFP9_9BACI|nr:MULTISPECIES: HPr family phosphocarrier protein [Salimicrobium]AKG03939.1 phosphocarrier protein Chr [Salimicrobium jeotgali]EKE32972.1 phosphocarrier protein Chr [Salimicrobium jeotgali]MBM7695032.1 catabolite repression HPr-like protein [Salimicrobium jeotgali]PBB06230.1 HPr family phosphocarrier protein [Salimicrobium humidisoli]SDX98954.1 catabolite repression HPr-like protein [Salimicrobium album]
MIEKKVKVELSTGLQARPAAQFVQLANRFSSDVFIEKNEKRVNAKSIMGLMSLAVAGDEEVVLVTDGHDEEEAMTKLEEFVKEA